MATTIIKDSYIDNTELIDGKRYTTQEDQNKLTNDEFLELLLEEMKMQDPTKPMDSQALMDSQLQMSTIDANQNMTTAMNTLTQSMSSSSLSNAVSLMNQVVEDGSVDEETDMIKSYKVATIESSDGDVFVNARQLEGYTHNVMVGTKNDNDEMIYNQGYADENGKLYNSSKEYIGISVTVQKDGSFEKDDSGNWLLYDKDGELITDDEVLEKVAIANKHVVYSDELTKINVNDVKKVSSGS